jgi:magnesium transporter
MEPQKAQEFLSLAKYPPDVAGGLMAKEFVAYPEDWTVADVMADLRAHAERYRDYEVQYAYIVRPPRVLIGVLRLRDLLLARPSQPVREIMVVPVSIRDRASLDELEEFFERHRFLGAPVVDGSGRLVGVVQRSALDQALADRGESDYRKSQGIVGGEELRTMPLIVRSRRRLSWLSANIILNIIAASVIAAYQETLAAVVALAVFLPIVSDMSGNSGFQAIAVTMREMSLGLVRPGEMVRVVSKEATVAFLNGLVLGLVTAAAAWLWKGNPYLGLVVGGAMALNTIVAACVGGVLPLILRKLGMDPALASGPILTTITDVCGFFMVLSFAAALLPKLAP